MKLISMTDFVLEQNKNTETLKNNFVNCANYANFLKQPLELWMFVPCDEEGKVLKEPDADYYMMVTKNEILKYQQAKERCLFKGFELVGQTDLSWIFRYKNKFPYFVNKKFIIEDLVKYNLELTQTAIK